MRRFLSRFLRSQDGAASIEFVIVFPIVMTMMLASIEMGVLMARQGMLDRGVDLAVRQVRLGKLDQIKDDPSRLHDAIRRMICEGTAMIPDCFGQVKLEMVPMNPRGSSVLRGDPDCIDRAASGQLTREIRSGTSNDLMLLRACVLFDPIFPTSGLSGQLIRQSGNAYALVSTSAFVIEP